jgi:hypothetical protein
MPEHPFRTAWRTRELDPWIQALSPEVLLRSPVLRRPFTGHDAARELFAVLFERFGPVQITSELGDETSRAFFWRGELAGRFIQGVDLLQYDADGRISEVAVLIRPLVDFGLFASTIGPPLAARRSPARGAILWLLAYPLKGILVAVDVVASRMLGLR